jgi:hypothetical protein
MTTLGGRLLDGEGGYNADRQVGQTFDLGRNSDHNARHPNSLDEGFITS